MFGFVELSLIMTKKIRKGTKGVWGDGPWASPIIGKILNNRAQSVYI